MSRTTSLAINRAYGVDRVCQAFDVPRSSYYSWLERQPMTDGGSISDGRLDQFPVAGKRGPKPILSDEELLVLIREDLASSPFLGEGHRKVWARLRVSKKARTSRKRVLRIMRENNLLSPHRVRQGPARTHEGRITTDAPNVMWGTDGARIFTVEDGWVWVFTTVEHWNAECMGWHVCKVGHRYNALQALSMALQEVFGSIEADVARGVALRMDHGSQFLSDHYQNQIRYWGIAPSFAFIEQPQTNGVAERFNRTMKEQAIWGRVFRNLEEVREAIRAFVDTYNEHWMIEKLGFLSPRQARREWDLQEAA